MSLLRRLSTNIMAKRSMNLSGIFPPITTPFNPDESLAIDKLRSNLDIWKQKGFRGYVVMGSNGEAPYLSVQEKVTLVKEVVQAVKGTDQVVMAGSGAESTRDTILLGAELAAAGAHCLLVISPSFYKSAMNNTAMLQHYTKVADASPVPILLYNVPGNTGIELPADVVVQMAKHKNCVGVKDSGGDISKISRMVAETKNEDFQVLCGSAGFLLPALQLGAVGGVCASANCLGAELVQLYEEYTKHGVTQKAIQLQAQLVVPNAAVTRGYGVAGLKHILDKSGYYGGPLRSPLQPLNQTQQTDIEKAFTDYAFKLQS